MLTDVLTNANPTGVHPLMKTNGIKRLLAHELMRVRSPGSLSNENKLMLKHCSSFVKKYFPWQNELEKPFHFHKKSNSSNQITFIKC